MLDSIDTLVAIIRMYRIQNPYPSISCFVVTLKPTQNLKTKPKHNSSQHAQDRKQIALRRRHQRTYTFYLTVQ
jgi:hypothetical protein